MNINPKPIVASPKLFLDKIDHIYGITVNVKKIIYRISNGENVHDDEIRNSLNSIKEQIVGQKIVISVLIEFIINVKNTIFEIKSIVINDDNKTSVEQCELLKNCINQFKNHKVLYLFSYNTILKGVSIEVPPLRVIYDLVKKIDTIDCNTFSSTEILNIISNKALLKGGRKSRKNKRSNKKRKTRRFKSRYLSKHSL